jgi:hypothetical protein
MKFLTFTEAAKAAGVNIKTIRKHVEQGKLRCVETPLGKRIPMDALTPYWTGRDESILDHGEEQTGPEREPFKGTVDQGHPWSTVDGREGTRMGAVPLEAHLAMLGFTQGQIERLQSELSLERSRMEHTERARITLEVQLGQYQRALSENAESLLEAKALCQSAELRLQDEERLLQENLRNQQIWDMEKEQLKAELEQKSRRVDWLEKRMPRWVRGLFGAM